MTRPVFWDEACTALAKADAKLGRVIAGCGPAHLVSRGDPFVTLARSIIGQQISVQAAQAVWNRFEAACGDVTPKRVCRMRAATLARCGLSGRKVEYVKDLAHHFESGAIDPASWSAMDDEAIITELVEVRGIGRWTAEMFLIFNLMRPDVYPIDDLGLLKAVALQYGGDDAAGLTPKARRQLAIDVGDGWRPWRSVATWYLWRSLDPVPVEY